MYAYMERGCHWSIYLKFWGTSKPRPHDHPLSNYSKHWYLIHGTDKFILFPIMVRSVLISLDLISLTYHIPGRILQIRLHISIPIFGKNIFCFMGCSFNLQIHPIILWTPICKLVFLQKVAKRIPNWCSSISPIHSFSKIVNDWRPEAREANIYIYISQRATHRNQSLPVSNWLVFVQHGCLRNQINCSSSSPIQLNPETIHTIAKNHANPDQI